MLLKYEAEVSSSVGGGERGVVDFGKLFTETNEQKFSLSSELEDLQSSRKRFGLEHREGDLCWRLSEFEITKMLIVVFKRSGSVAEWLECWTQGAEGSGFKSQPRRRRVTVLGKLFTPIVPLFTKQQKW